VHLAVTGFLLSLSLCLDIGAVNTAILTTGAKRGFRAAWWMGVGSCFGDLVYALIATAGVTLWFATPTAQAVLRVAGTAVLLWFAYGALRAAWQPDGDAGKMSRIGPAARAPAQGTPQTAATLDTTNSTRAASAAIVPATATAPPDAPGSAPNPARVGRDLLLGLTLALSSPSAILWFATVGGSLIAAEHPAHVGAALTLFLGGFFAAGLAWSAFIAAVAHAIGRTGGTRTIRWLHLVSGIMFLGFAARLWWPGA
jgi:L-lysine exporter family protein LysE/ArgO